MAEKKQPKLLLIKLFFNVFDKLAEAKLKTASVPCFFEVRNSSLYAVECEFYGDIEALLNIFPEGAGSREYACENITCTVKTIIDITVK